MGSGGSPEILKTAKAHVLSDFFAKRGNTTLSFSTSKGDALAFVRLIVELDGVSHRVTFKMTKWTSDFAVSWQKVTGVAAGAARELPTNDPWSIPAVANIYSQSSAAVTRRFRPRAAGFSKLHKSGTRNQRRSARCRRMRVRGAFAGHLRSTRTTSRRIFHHGK